LFLSAPGADTFWLGAAMTAARFFSAMRPGDATMNWLLFAQQENNQAYENGRVVGMIFGALLVGAIGAAIVKKVADSRGQSVLGWLGAVITLVAGFLFGLLGAVPSVAVFCLIAFVLPDASRPRKSAKSPGARNPAIRTPSKPYDI
jgi:hypothetical protein